MIGIQCLDVSGEVYFDTNNKNYFHCVGVLRSKRRGYDSYIQIPVRFRNTNTILVGNISYNGLDSSIPWNPSSSGTFTFWTPPAEIYVYIRGSLVGDEGSYGIVTYDESGVPTFSSERESKVLQITSTYSDRNGVVERNLGIRDSGLIVASQPAVRNQNYPGFGQTNGVFFRRNNGIVTTPIGVVSSGYEGGGFRKSTLSLAFVKLPLNVPEIVW